MRLTDPDLEEVLAESFDGYAAQALPVLLESLRRQARLSPSGWESARASLAAAARENRNCRRLRRLHPEIGAVNMPGPLFITGLFRTGSTMLHHLLARHPGLRVPPLWQTMAPSGGLDEASQIARAEAYVVDYTRRAPRFGDLHQLAATEPDECHRLTGNSLHADIYGLRYDVPSYTTWLDGRDLTDAYRLHREHLQTLLWRYRRDGADGPVVMKCPSHLWHLESLARVYPHARVVRLHRHPIQSLPSLCGLTEVVRSARSDAVDPHAIGRHWMSRTRRVLEGTRPAATVHGLPVLDIAFEQLVADPVSTAARVSEFAGVPVTEAAESGMRTYLAAQPNRTAHRYRADDFGLRTEQIRAEFAGYVRAFDLDRPSTLAAKGSST